MNTRQRLLVVAGEDAVMRLATFTHLQSVGFDVAVAAPVNHVALTGAGIPFFQYDLVRNVHLLADLRAIGQLRKIANEWVPHIIHAYDTKPCYLVPLALRGITGPKVLRTVNGMGKVFTTDSPKNHILRIIYKCLHWFAKSRVDHTIFQNSTDHLYYINKRLVHRHKTTIIPGSGIDMKYFTAFKNKSDRSTVRAALGLNHKTIFILIARITKEKGVLDYLDAAREIRSRHPNTAFLLAGPAAGDEPNGINLDLINSYASDVTYLGRRDDIPQLLNASDVFVLPTKYREGVPRAMLEAMAMGLPVIVSDIPGCHEAIKGRGSGFLLSTSDNHALVKAIELALNSDLSAMGASGQMDIENTYALPVVMGALTNIYRNII